MVRRGLVILYLLFATAAAPTTYATAGDHAITQGDVIRAVGYVPSYPGELADVVTGLVEREIILGLAERKGITASDAELNRTLALISKTRGTNNFLAAEDYRRYVREEIIIGKYIDEYVYPRITISDEQLERLFLLIPAEFVKPVPGTRTRLLDIFPLYRNKVLSKYVKIEVARLLREDIGAVEKLADVKYYIKVEKK